MPGSWQAAGSYGCNGTWLDACHPLSSCSQHIDTLLQQGVRPKPFCSVTHVLHLPAGLIGAPGMGKSAALQGLLLLACQMAKENPYLLQSDVLKRLEACC